MMMTDLVAHCPRVRFSRTQLAAILLWGSILGASSVPTASAVTLWEEAALKLLGNPERRFVSMLGNVFYLNSIAHSLALDFSKAELATKMHFYPEIGGSALQEFRQGSLYGTEAPDECLTPMLRHDSRQWFVGEVLLCRDGRFFVPLRWVQFAQHAGEMGAVGWAVLREDGRLRVLDQQRIHV
ncbi:hypothetical protein CALCODRAFT_433357 [Calocera cornea HHB12733]|uniref:Uncharacterized protein n=1 Tax=Calocera cornea HHB12733 TaxID=1353952 RepID=A0A165GFU1_9BASI|nr:hypothetical protein CALCODRAFT_433357 [Calocera cornea HHB12733]